MPTIPLLKKKIWKKNYNSESKRKERQSVYQNPAYKKLRNLHIREFPVCQICELEGKVTPTEHIHHIISFVGQPEPYFSELAFSYDNLLSVCRNCHTRCHETDLKGLKSLKEIEDRIKSKKN